MPLTPLTSLLADARAGGYAVKASHRDLEKE